MNKISWDQLHRQIEDCNQCPLAKGCTYKVPGQGNGQAPLMLIGEGPGQREDETGIAFVGPAGQLLTKMLQSIGLDRRQVYITNIVKCRPPKNRQPTAEEAACCLPFLRMQAGLVRPRIILLLGASAMQALLGEQMRITRDHGKWYQRKNTLFMGTFHPSALLRDEGKKALAWKDLKKLRAYMEQEKLFPIKGAE